jgi:vitamin B12 transporter
MHSFTPRHAVARPLARSLPASIALAFAALNAAAAPAADAGPDTVVVTATRTPQRADQVIADTVVIDRAEIARAGVGSVADLLRRQRGIEITRNGGAGNATSVFLRGANSNQVLVLVDGVRIAGATTGGASWNVIPLSAIDHIEIVYGPLSSLYGADAIGGVVQIFTRRGEGAPAFSASLGGGSYGTGEGEASVSGATGGAHSVSYALSAGREESDGFTATRPGAFGFNPDDDGYARHTVNGRVAVKLAEGHEAGAQFLKSRLWAQYDSGTAAYDTHNVQMLDSYALFLNDRFLPNWNSSVQVARAFDKQGSFEAARTDQIDTRQDELTWQNTLALGPDTLQVLFGHRKEKVMATSLASALKGAKPILRITNSVALSYGLKRDAHLVDVSVRSDHASYGAKTTGALGYGYQFNKDLRATLSAGTSFRAPSFNELYYPGYGFEGNKPEKGRNLEAGLHWQLGTTALQANYYRNRLTDMLITANPCPNPGSTGSCAYNVNHAMLKGLTLSSDTRLNAWTLHANADLQDPRDETTGKQLVRRARRHATVAADYEAGPVQTGLELQASGQRFDDARNANRLGGYGLVNLYTIWHVSPDWSLLLRADNLADKRYETARYYGAAGRSVFASIRYGFR